MEYAMKERLMRMLLRRIPFRTSLVPGLNSQQRKEAPKRYGASLTHSSLIHDKGPFPSLRSNSNTLPTPGGKLNPFTSPLSSISSETIGSISQSKLSSGLMHTLSFLKVLSSSKTFQMCLHSLQRRSMSTCGRGGDSG